MPPNLNSDRSKRVFRQRCLRVWQVLVRKAQDGEAITYLLLSNEAEVPMPVLRQSNLLKAVYRYCRHNGLPPLAVLAVRKSTGRPGKGYEGIDIEGDTRQVFGADWRSIPTPEEDDF